MRPILNSALLLTALLAAPAWAFRPVDSSSSALASKAFVQPELSIPSSQVPLEKALPRMNRLGASAWEDFFARNGRDFRVYVDAMTGTATNIMGAIPLIPGDGVGNKVSLEGVSQQLGRPVPQVSEAVVADLVVQFIKANQAAIGVDALQLGTPRVSQVAEHLWQISIPQQLKGIPVRYGRLAATLSHGNLILLGTESWRDADVAPQPLMSADQAMSVGNERLGLLESPAELWQAPVLEIIPVARPDAAFGEGYGHKLVWTYGFRLPGEHARWKVTVDSQRSEVLSLEDDNHYLDATLKGGVYSLTNTDTCTATATCGAMFANTPMPWANTGFPFPNNFTDSAGVFNYTAGTTNTSLDGKYVRIIDNCGPTAESAFGSINLGGAGGQHDCTTPGPGSSAGNTSSSRSAYYELNRIAELARGWLPTNVWLQSQLTSNMDINSSCNAYWNGTVNFFKSGGGCRNTGEIAAVADHEWGHGLDDNDVAGTLSNSSEAYADIAAIYRLPTSCVGYGFYNTAGQDQGCGMTPDGTGYNVNEAQVGAPWCASRCSGVRDANWGAHANLTPATPQNFVCSRCWSGGGPCGRQEHCAASPVRQAAWDLVARDLRAPPFSYDANTALIMGNKIFYQGSGNIGTWHACNCAGNTSDGCGATNGYMQWLAADDDNGNVNDGTPHMTAIHAAFNRHNIACNLPSPANTGCGGGPTAAPTLNVTASAGQAALSWSPVAGATQYWVMKSEGFAACAYGKARVATVTGTTYVDGEVASGRSYCYSIVPASTNACYGRASVCTCGTPT